jgi:hypothetical protein
LNVFCLITAPNWIRREEVTRGKKSPRRDRQSLVSEPRIGLLPIHKGILIVLGVC